MRWVGLFAVILLVGAAGIAIAQTDVRTAAAEFDLAQQVGDRATLERIACGRCDLHACINTSGCC